MTITCLYISPRHEFYRNHAEPVVESPMVSVESVECVAGKGLQGDRYFGFDQDYKGQATFFSLEEYERLCELLQVTHRDPSVFRRNIIVQGVDLNTLIGKEFEVQGVRFLGTEECSPCRWMNEAFAPGAERALRGHGGLRVRILSDGMLRCGS